MSTIKYEVRPGAYYDSVVLMQLQRSLAGLAGVVDAGVVMATAANRELLAASDLLPDKIEAKADDLLIVV
jgi:FdrA protein